MKPYVVALLVLPLAACDPAVQSAKQVCKQMEETGNFTYTANNMTPESCACTLTEVRKTLSDDDWNKFLVVLNGGDPFQEQSVPDGALDDESAPAAPPALLRIEAATTTATEICAVAG